MRRAGFAERIARKLRECVLNGGVRLSTSAGVATLGEDGSDVESLLIAADRALHAAKTAGRARVVAAGDPIVAPLSAA